MIPALLKVLGAFLPAFWLVSSSKGGGVRNRVISAANRVVGLKAGEGSLSGEAFRKLLGEPPAGSKWDLDRPFRILPDGTTQGTSTCGLVTRGIHCEAGLHWPEYYKPYLPGRVFTDMIGLAMKHGAWRTSGLPESGDAFVIGNGYQTHMATCINVDGSEVLSVDGGQVDAVTGLQCIKQVSRDFRQVHLQGIIDVDKLAVILSA